MNLEQGDKEAAAVAVAPRVTLADIEASIFRRYDFNAAEAIGHLNIRLRPMMEVDPALELLSICILVLHNGFTVVGKSAPASPANFNAELGRKLAYEDCIRQLWPLMGFALRDRLAKEENA